MKKSPIQLFHSLPDGTVRDADERLACFYNR